MFEFRSSQIQRWRFTDGEAEFQPISWRAMPAPGWQSPPEVMSERNAVLKRAFDVVVAAVGLALFILPMLVAIIAIRLDSHGAPLFRQRRIGLNGAAFHILKFRTMGDRQAPPGLLHQATQDDPRVTRIGRWLRRTSFDEIPQLLNVLLGTMSIVGPRPHAPGTCAAGRLFETVTNRYAARHCVKPGMTGLAQVRGWRGETDTEAKLLGRVDSDLEYIATWSLWLDVRIVWRTVFTVLSLRNAW
jgi:lipopolysaccharide/colanic/teichoic acid biosynthesis glycosyltransferase